MSLLKNSIYAFIGNLCIDKTLRTCFANDQAEILSQIVKDFKLDLAGKAFDWQDMVNKQLAIFINVTVEPQA
jgi:5'-3' exonuclease